ncbi:F0F1 ATP synthase subunit delta [Candidatus Peribacteria bacterium]|nr:MAG: F0F1 ATP synthase subunit delta [Candidatus Peribacteria bacterium]
MKIKPEHIAQALADLSLTIPQEQFSDEVDSALMYMRQNSPGKSIRQFPYVLERVLRRKGRMFSAVLSTPTGEPGEHATAIQKILENHFKHEVELDVVADPSLIGGAVLRVQDELFDLSAAGALELLRSYLVSHSHHSTPSHESQ